MLVNFFNSGFFIALTTLVVGVSALAVYQRQRHDSKRDAANIILLEIENAERQLQKVRDVTSKENPALPENIVLMPTESWSKYQHLFVRDFDRGEWDMLADFYEKCQRYDQAAAYNNTFFNENVVEIRSNLHRVLADYARDFISAHAEENQRSDPELNRLRGNYLEKRRKFIEIYHNADPQYLYFFAPKKPVSDALTVLGGIETNLSVTSIGIKLKAQVGRKR